MQSSSVQMEFMMAIEQNNLPQLLHLLESNPELLHGPEKPLHYAIQHGKKDIVPYLLQAGANIHAFNANGLSALDVAVLGGDPYLVRTLMNYGADPHLMNEHNQTAMELVGNNVDIREILIYPPLPSHYWLIERIKNAGYFRDNPDVVKGVCFGLENMANFSFLVGELDKFTNRLYAINSIPADRFGAEIELARRIEKDAFEKQKKILYPDVAVLTNEQRTHISKVVDEMAKEPSLIKDARDVQEMAGLFEGIEVFHNESKHRELFPVGAVYRDTDITASAPIISSSKMEQLGGIAKVASFTGIYRPEALVSLLKTLRAQLTEKPALSHPVSLSIHNINHAISIGFDPVTNSWTFIDANHLPPIKLTSEDNLVKMIFPALLSKNQAAISTEIFTTGNQLAQVKEKMNTWHANPSFRAIHNPNKRGAKDNDANNISWLFLAIYKRDEAEVIRLLKAEHDANRLVTDSKNNKLSLLQIAIDQKDFSIVREMLKFPNVDPNIKSYDDARKIEETLLSHAVASTGSSDNIELVNLLLAAKADPNIVNSRGESALFVAVLFNNERLVNTLLNANANPNLVAHQQSTLIQAVIMGNEEIVRLLIKNGADVNYVNSDNDTALHMAIRVGNPKILAMVLEANPALLKNNDGSALLTLAGNNNEIKEMLREKIQQDLPQKMLEIDAKNEIKEIFHETIQQDMLQKPPEIDVKPAFINSVSQDTQHIILDKQSMSERQNLNAKFQTDVKKHIEKVLRKLKDPATKKNLDNELVKIEREINNGNITSIKQIKDRLNQGLNKQITLLTNLKAQKNPQKNIIKKFATFFKPVDDVTYLKEAVKVLAIEPQQNIPPLKNKT